MAPYTASVAKGPIPKPLRATTHSPLKCEASLVSISILATILLNKALATVNPLDSWEHWGISPPTFDAAAPQPLSCYEQLFMASNATCSLHRSEALPVTIRSCTCTSNTGVLLLQRNNNTSSSGTLGMAIYRLRVTGPAGLWLLEPSYCRPDLACATYSLPAPGRYSVEVLMLYDNFTYTEPARSKPRAEPWAGYLTLQVGGRPTATAGGGTGAAALAGGPPLLQEAWSPAPDHSAIFQQKESRPEPRTSAVPSSVPPQQQQRQHDSEQLTELGGGGATLPLCNDTGPLPGRWRFRVWPPSPSDAVPLLRTCIWGESPHGCNLTERAALRSAGAAATLYWQPDGCSLRSVHGLPPPLGAGRDARQRQLHQVRTVATPAARRTPSSQPRQRALAPLRPLPPQQLQPPPLPPVITKERCLPRGRRICFLGDSHSRYLHNSLVLWSRGFKVKVDYGSKKALSSSQSVYLIAVWGTDWPKQRLKKNGSEEDPLLALKCTDVVVNFGQWDASHQAGAAPHSAARYVSSVLAVRQKMLELRRRHGLRVFWVTSGLPSLKLHLELAGKDWRTDPYMLLYNRLASDAMRGSLGLPSLAAVGSAELHGARGDGHPDSGGSKHDRDGRGGSGGEVPIPIIDIWSLSYILSDATRDGTHFENTGLVGIAELRVLLHALCSEAIVGDGGAVRRPRR